MITNLEVEWVGDELRARWEGGTDPTVFVSASPDDAGTVIVPVETPGRLRIAGLPVGFRAFVHVLDLDGRWTVAGQRLLRLAEAVHAVDLGGRLAPDGRTVRWGRLYASDPIDDLDAAGRGALAGLGLATVADLRTGEDSAGRPPWLDPTWRWELPGMGEGDGSHPLLDQVAGVLDLVAAEDGLPLLFHGGVGSDRAAVVAALVLSAIGLVDWELPFFPTRAQVLAEVRAGHGSVEAALVATTGLAPATIAAAREILLVA